jgi:hypothetical protein
MENFRHNERAVAREGTMPHRDWQVGKDDHGYLVWNKGRDLEPDLIVVMDIHDSKEAHLIAAAPALLAACEAWDKLMDAIGIIPQATLTRNGLAPDAGDQAIELTHAAIKRARGKACDCT